MEGLAGAPCVLTRVIAPDQQAQRLVAQQVRQAGQPRDGQDLCLGQLALAQLHARNLHHPRLPGRLRRRLPCRPSGGPPASWPCSPQSTQG